MIRDFVKESIKGVIMRKLNNKGMTLIELIVSFVLVAVAATYFYSTLDVVVKLYKESTNETDKFVEEDYAIRMAEACLNNGVATKYYTKGYSSSAFWSAGNIKKIKLTKSGKTIEFYYIVP